MDNASRFELCFGLQHVLRFGLQKKKEQKSLMRIEKVLRERTVECDVNEFETRKPKEPLRKIPSGACFGEDTARSNSITANRHY